jgi:hypothetical protein
MATTSGDGKALNIQSLARKNFSSTVTIPKYTIVSVDATNKGGVTIPADAGAVGTPLGVAMEDILPGAVGEIRVYGTATVLSAGTVAAGVFVTASNTAGQNGRTVAAGAGAAAVGITLNATTGAGQEQEVFLSQARNALHVQL